MSSILLEIIIFSTLVLFNVVQWYQNDNRLKNIDRDNRRERELLIRQILHLSGQKEYAPRIEREELEELDITWTPTPEHDLYED